MKRFLFFTAIAFCFLTSDAFSQNIDSQGPSKTPFVVTPSAIEGITVYPNPTIGRIIVDLGSYPYTGILQLINSNLEIIEEVNIAGEEEYVFNLLELESGIYTVKFITPISSETKTVIRL